MSEDHYPDGECECHCPSCGEPREPDPFGLGYFATCGDCFGGREPDYDRACEIAAKRDPTHPDNVEAWRLKR